MTLAPTRVNLAKQAHHGLTGTRGVCPGQDADYRSDDSDNLLVQLHVTWWDYCGETLAVACEVHDVAVLGPLDCLNRRRAMFGYLVLVLECVGCGHEWMLTDRGIILSDYMAYGAKVVDFD